MGEVWQTGFLLATGLEERGVDPNVVPVFVSRVLFYLVSSYPTYYEIAVWFETRDNEKVKPDFSEDERKVLE